MVKQVMVTISLVFGATAVFSAVGCVTEKAGCVQPAAPVTMVNKSETVQKPDKTLLFFMNPNGRPCQMQDEILAGAKDSIAVHAAVRYYKTTESTDHGAFGQYGIRGLPSLILIDKSGKTLHRFTPGINDGNTILNAMRK